MVTKRMRNDKYGHPLGGVLHVQISTHRNLNPKHVLTCMLVVNNLKEIKVRAKKSQKHV